MCYVFSVVKVYPRGHLCHDNSYVLFTRTSGSATASIIHSSCFEIDRVTSTQAHSVHSETALLPLLRRSALFVLSICLAAWYQFQDNDDEM